VLSQFPCRIIRRYIHEKDRGFLLCLCTLMLKVRLFIVKNSNRRNQKTVPEPRLDLSLLQLAKCLSMHVEYTVL